MRPVDLGALRTIGTLTPDAAADDDADRHPYRKPDRKMSGCNPEDSAQGRSQRDA
jgi:hypothetical protein